jgi:serine/threonine protein kinase
MRSPQASDVRVRELFEKALQQPADSRTSFVRERARGEDRVIGEVLELLQASEDRLRSSLGMSPEDGSSLHGTATFELLQKLAVTNPLDLLRYRVEKRIGRGGMGEVMSVWDAYLNRQLAMKVMLSFGAPRDDLERQMSHQMLGRFLEEAQVTSQLDHPGVVPVHELGLDEHGRVYFTMRLVKGQTLRDTFEKAFTEADGWNRLRALEVMLKVCDTMAYAHSKGVLHRDLKPANVMVGRFGEVYVMDWGLAKVLGQQDRHDLRIREESRIPDEEMTVSARTLLRTARNEDADTVEGGSVVSMDGQQLGTPAYMAPEQARSEPVDARADVYALGAMLYTLLAGRAPYVKPDVAMDAHRMLEKVIAGPPERIDAIAADVPAELVAIVERAMARNMVGRYQTVVELADDLRAFLDQRVVQAYQTGAVAEMKMWIRRNKPLAASLAAAAALLVVGLVGVSWFWREAIRAEEAERSAKVVALDLQGKETKAREEEAKARKVADAATVAANASAAAARTAGEGLEEANKTLKEQRDELQRTIVKFEQVKGVVDYARVMADADAIWSSADDRRERMRSWLREAELVLNKKSEFEARIRDLRRDARDIEGRALALLSAEQAAKRDRASELDRRRERLLQLLAVHEGRQELPDPKLPDDWKPAEKSKRLVPIIRQAVKDLEEAGWDLAAFVPPPHHLAAALSLAKEKSTTGDTNARLAFFRGAAFAAHGAESRAMEEFGKALGFLGNPTSTDGQGVADLRSQIQMAQRLVATKYELLRLDLGRVDHEIRQARADLAEIERRRLVFPDTDAGKLADFLHRESATFVANLTFLEARRDILERELGWEQRLDELPPALRDKWGRLWQECERELVSNPRYASQKLQLGPRLRRDVVPLGANPSTGLLEFYHLRSAWDGRVAAADLAIPKFSADGRIEVDGDTGIVFVLVPAGRFQRDVGDAGPEPVSRSVGAILVARHELSQAQWARLWLRDPAQTLPSALAAGTLPNKNENLDETELITLAHPVENVDWRASSFVLADHGMRLPTHDEWEHACRADSSGPRAFRDEELNLYCNLRGTDDGHSLHAKVGSYRPNRFGLHDVYGNVCEWIVDGKGRQVCGGAFDTMVEMCRSSAVFVVEPGTAARHYGLRAVRDLD